MTDFFLIQRRDALQARVNELTANAQATEARRIAAETEIAELYTARHSLDETRARAAAAEARLIIANPMLVELTAQHIALVAREADLEKRASARAAEILASVGQFVPSVA